MKRRPRWTVSIEKGGRYELNQIAMIVDRGSESRIDNPQRK